MTAAPARLGRYELLGQLATGGMAEIHLARLAGEAGFEKLVVLKRLLPELVASKAFVAMFLEEGKLVARIDHPNVCEVHELGRDGAEYFLVMPYLDGVPATDFIARPRDPDRLAQLRVAAGIIVQACAGLHHAHELKGPDGDSLGLVHRDISPSNLFVTTSGLVKVLDFGVAKVRGAAETEAGTIKGKTQYMSPEQLLGEALDRRSDVFALGIVLYELATHQRLFKRSSDYLSARAILEEAIPRADAVDPAVPAPLADVIARALARSPGDRFGDARELARALEAAMAPHGGVAASDAIAAALAEWHADELTAQRTRQARVLADARTRDTSTATLPASPHARRSTADVAASPAARADDEPATTLARRRRPILRIVAPALLVAVAGGAVLVATRTHEPTGPAVTGSEMGSAATGSAATVAGSAAATDPVPAPVPAPAPAPARVPAPAPVRAPAADPHAHPKHAPQPGFFSVDAKPDYATIFIDNTRIGPTPIINRSLPAGRHTLRAVRADGHTVTRTITIPESRSAPPLTITW